MSVAGMVLIDWAFHVYMAALALSVHAFTYVDNVSEAGHDVMHLLHYLLFSALGTAVGLWEDLFLEYYSIIKGHFATFGFHFAL